MDGHEEALDERQLAAFNTVGPGFSRTARIPVLKGRELTRGDHADAPPAAVVNPALAENYFPGERAIGTVFGDSGPAMSGGDVRGVCQPAVLSVPSHAGSQRQPARNRKRGFTDGDGSLVFGDPITGVPFAHKN